jgi:hypothetical protein
MDKKTLSALGILAAAGAAIGTAIYASKNPDKVQRITDSAGGFFKKLGDKAMDTLFGPAEIAPATPRTSSAD